MFTTQPMLTRTAFFYLYQWFNNSFGRQQAVKYRQWYGVSFDKFLSSKKPANISLSKWLRTHVMESGRPFRVSNLTLSGSKNPSLVSYTNDSEYVTNPAYIVKIDGSRYYLGSSPHTKPDPFKGGDMVGSVIYADDKYCFVVFGEDGGYRAKGGFDRQSSSVELTVYSIL